MRQGGVLSPQLFAIYMDDLSVCLTQCKVGCHLNETVTNHVVYAGDICLMAPSAIALQKYVLKNCRYIYRVAHKKMECHGLPILHLHYNVTNGVRQGGILSPKLFNSYIDGLSNNLY